MSDLSGKLKWDENLAYAIGLIASDGSLSKDGRHIIMKSSDREILENFKECLDLTNEITTGQAPGGTKPSYIVQLSNVKFYKQLLKIGLFPNKTYTIGEIDIKECYFPDFLRGELDGDGSVYSYIDDYNTYKGKRYIYERLYTKFTSVSENYIKWLRSRIIDLREVEGNLYKDPPSEKGRVPRWTLRFAKKKSIKLLSWIYYRPNLPCLARKRKTAEKFI